MTHLRTLSAAEVAYLRKALADVSIPVAVIRKRLRVGGPAFARLLGEHDIKPRAKAHHRWPAERDAELLRLHGQGLKGPEIGLRMGCSKNAVNLRLMRLRDGGVLAAPVTAPTRLRPGYEDMLRRVARWDGAAAKALRVYESQIAQAAA